MTEQSEAPDVERYVAPDAERHVSDAQFLQYLEYRIRLENGSSCQ